MKKFSMLILFLIILYADFPLAQLNSGLKNSAGGSSLSPPPVPSFTVTPGIRTNLIEWTGDYDIIKIYRDETSPPTTLVYTLTSGTSQLDTPLVAGTTYYYRVTGSEYNTMTSEYSSIVDAVPEDISTIDPATLSPTRWFDENERANNSWGDKLTTNTFGDGGAESWFLQEQNGLAWWESDGGGTPYFVSSTTLMPMGATFSIVFVLKNRVAGNSNNGMYFFNSSSGYSSANLKFLRAATTLYPSLSINDGTNEAKVTGDYAMNDNQWKIIVLTVSQATNNCVIKVYQNNGTNLSDTETSWTVVTLNGFYNGTGVGGGNGLEFASWFGMAEMILFDKILTLEEVNGVGAWLANKWAITWTDNE